jgi:proline iminopeptidase
MEFNKNNKTNKNNKKIKDYSNKTNRKFTKRSDAKRSDAKRSDAYIDTALYPIIKPYKTGFLQVSKIHKIAYFLYGNPNGKPVLSVHGGPGAGTTPDYARFFNPKKYNIVLVDQRGTGKSKPFGEIKENTTNDLISDFEKIRKMLNIEKWQIFGGSWGSTLSLAYSIKHPEIVSELVLRGIFTFEKKEIDWVQQGPGANYVFPEAWEMYKNTIPENERGDFLKAYGKRFNGSMGEQEKDKACLAWSQWEASISHLIPTPHNKIIKDLKKNKNYIPMAIIEHHYFINNGFFPKEGYLLEERNLNKIKQFPITIVQGIYDMVCPMKFAFNLHNKLPNAIFYKTLAGHSMFEKENIRHLVMTTDKYASRV